MTHDIWAGLPDQEWRVKHGALPRESYLEGIGKYAAEADEFLKRLDLVQWSSNVSEPPPPHLMSLPHAQVFTQDDALKADGTLKSKLVRYKAGYLLLSSGLIADFHAPFKAGSELVHFYGTNNYPHEYGWEIAWSIEHTIFEIISQEVNETTFFRDQWVWYEAGHWICGYTENDLPIIY